MKTLTLADNLKLPLDFATKTAAILAQRRKGKTYTASVIAEEMVAAKQPFVALDPTGAWWGLRASADGQRDGLPVIVLGGQHGDVPLERTAGRLIADLVVDEPGYYVIDFSLFESGEAERQFAVDFAERLYRAKGQPGKDFTLHLFVDEADRFIPQQMRKGSNETSPRLLGAFEAIVRRGGLRGLGTTLISQRAAVVNKNVLEMLDVLIALRTVGPNDRQAIKNYIDAHGTEAEQKEMLGSLASLDIGEAWIWEPGAEPPLFERVRIRQRTTFNSSATPKPGQTRSEPRRLAAVDLAKLQERMAATIEKAKQDDPKELRKQVAGLQQQLTAAQRVKGETPVSIKTVDKPVLTDADRALLQQLAAAIRFRADKAQEIVTAADSRADRLVQTAVAEYLNTVRNVGVEEVAFVEKTLERIGLQKILTKLEGVTTAAPGPGGMAGAVPPARVTTPQRGASDRVAPRAVATSARPVARADASPGSAAAEVGTSGAYRMLVALAQQHTSSCTASKLALLTGIARTGGTFRTYLGKLKTLGWIEGRGDALAITSEGLTALGDYDPLPTGAALIDFWRGELGHSGLRVLFDLMVEAYPRALTREDLATRANMAADGGTFRTYLGRLRTLELIERRELRASDVLFLQGAA